MLVIWSMYRWEEYGMTVKSIYFHFSQQYLKNNVGRVYEAAYDPESLCIP